MFSDSTTAAAYAAASTAQAKAQAVSDSLGSGTLTVEIKDGSTLKYSGDFAGPMTVGADGTMSMAVVPSGTVVSAGTADAATWTCRIRNADDSRYIVDSIGSGGRFSLRAPLAVGQSVDLNVAIGPAPTSVQTYGLTFPSNGVSGSNLALDWTGADMVPAHSHTVIWKARYVQQTGYYAVTWHCRADDSYSGGPDYIGAHPYPCDGTADADGQASSGHYGSGYTTHYFEVVSRGGRDYICTAGGTPLAVTKDQWYSQARTVEVINSGTQVRFRYWPDIENNSSYVIEIIEAIGDVTLSGNALKFRIGCSPWDTSGSGAGSTAGETVSGTLRHILQYDTALTLAQIQAKLALTADDTTDANIWYSNLNPRPDDVTDKSGAGHHPSWANSNRPTLYTG